MTPQKYCEEKAARSGSSFYYSFLFLPVEQREAITALYAFCREVDDVVDDCTEPEVARAKLQWWRQEIGRLFEGSPQHPVTQALSGPIERYNLPAEHFIEVIDGMEMDLDYDSYPTFKELALYCHRVASMVGLMSAEIFGYEDRRTLKYAHELGMAFQLTNIIRDIQEDARRGRLYVPLEDLEHFGVNILDIRQGRMTENVRKLLAFQAERAQQYYDQAFDHLPEVDRYRQMSGLVMAAIYRTLLQEIENKGFDVLDERINLTPIRKFWLAWKTVRRERRRHKRGKATKRSQ